MEFMKRLISYVMAAVAGILCLFGCREEAGYVPVSYLTVDTEVLVSPASASAYSIEVDSNTSWNAVFTNNEWVSSSVKEFVGATSLKVNFAENTGGNRSCTLIIESADGQFLHEIEIRQLGAGDDGCLSISTVRALAADGEYMFPEADFKVKGIVTTNAAEGNFYENAFIIQDDFVNPHSAILVESPSPVSFVQGEEAVVALNGVTVKRNENGYLAIYASEPAVSSGITPVAIEPLMIDVAALESGDYEAMYVSVPEVQISEALLGSTYGSSPSLVTTEFLFFNMQVFETATFAEQACPNGGGVLSGIATPDAAIMPTTVDDIAFGDIRLEINALSELPYMFSLYCEDGGDNNSYAYIAGKDQGYDAATFTRDIWYYDVAKPSIMLNSHSAGHTSDQTRGTLVWANKYGYDNAPSKSFVSKEYLAAAEMEGETYYMLSCPLAMDLPQRFSVTVGLYLQDTFKNWKVEYSKDMQNWYGFDAADESTYISVPEKDLFHYGTVTFDSEIEFRSEETLYIKVSPFGLEQVGSGGPWNKDARLVSGIYVSSAMPQETAAPAGALWFEPFDGLTEGTDYTLGTKLGMMDNLNGSLIDSWTEEQKNGMSGENVAQRPGYAQIGWVDVFQRAAWGNYKMENNIGSLVSPKLGREGSLEVSFSAMGYRTNADRKNNNTIVNANGQVILDVQNPDVTSFVVEVIGGGTISGAASAVFTGLSASSWKEFDFKVENATADTRIKFTSPADAVYTRWFIDNILVK